MIIHAPSPAYWRRLGGREGGGAHRTCRAGWCESRRVRSAQGEMLFCCGHQLNVASLSGLTPQWETPGAPLGCCSAGTRTRRATSSGPARSRKCGLLPLSIRNKWLQRSRCELVNMNCGVTAGLGPTFCLQPLSRWRGAKLKLSHPRFHGVCACESES